MKARDLYLGMDALKVLCEISLPIQLAYTLDKNKALLEGLYTLIEKERISIVEKYTAGDPLDKEQSSNNHLDKEKATIAFEAYLDEDVVINIEPVDINDLPSNIEMSINQLSTIRWLFK